MEAPSTSAFAPCPMDSASADEINAAANEPPPLETVVVQPAPRPQNKPSVQVLRVEVPEAPVRPEHFSGSEAPMAGSTLPLNSDAARANRPPQALRHPRPHAIPPIAAPLCTRWCCAKISMISMAIMSLFAAFMVYAFREDASLSRPLDMGRTVFGSCYRNPSLRVGARRVMRPCCPVERRQRFCNRMPSASRAATAEGGCGEAEPSTGQTWRAPRCRQFGTCLVPNRLLATVPHRSLPPPPLLALPSPRRPGESVLTFHAKG
ncbi:hypothetical protein HPB50_020350 [Hyalomma asiaticum]|uniref:Uncharacterized protein n=1 Tax=Hyalomma asiaticum TaxID=266040 RepID=A0ACB7SRG4_HYAAI|nr:hypothetical protein HPB50_020350 [Hyalomma asiaticum]